MTERVVIPGWCNEGLRRVEKDVVLLKALHSHHQGLALEEIAPSHSLLAYVGAIEGIGAKLEDLRRCECCSECTINVGSGRRFRQALKLVMTSREARALASAYDRRSKIAHEGALLGGEDHGGAPSPAELFAPRLDTEDFVYQTLWSMKDASRRVVCHFLRSEEVNRTLVHQP